ncbi:PREDICTED: uncharacterized protein LOC109168132 isoform X2 [Ipomoea nil]|uniref:uncharacterized protein LOC109168132 isoform X2 n=1 Tax=Ipomoea nil TaxID=35883 RepID=UPI000900ED1B|nr:PREDICTED: uncharacterized protein LOC109168132 isoform X2 [Ipomoea nil]
MASQGNNVDDLEAGNYVGEEDFSKYLTLHRATVHGKWGEAQKFLEDNNNNRAILLAPINFQKNTVLHDAAKTGNNKVFVEKLVAMMAAMGDDNKELGVVKNRDGMTALHLAARFGNKEVAEILVGKNPNLLYQRCNRGLLPIHYAACNTRSCQEVFRYFWGVTKDDEDPQVNPYAGPTGATILVNLIKSKFYDEAMELVDKYPDLARHPTLDEDISPLEAIIKYGYPIIDKTKLSETSIREWMCLKMEVKEIKEQEQPGKLLEFLCQKLGTLNDKEVASVATKAIIEAAHLDIDKVVEKVVEAYPRTAYYQDKISGRNILQIAVENRCKNVFNLVCGTKSSSCGKVLMHDLMEERDDNENNILHSAGKLPPPHKLNRFSGGAARQMQRELQWFKAVEKIAPPYFSSLKNKDHKTPKMVFTDEHRSLKTEAEKWMKETATACSVVAVLIATVAFAAAVTVPGGTYGELSAGGFNGTIGYPLRRGRGVYNSTIIVPGGNITEAHGKEGSPIFSGLGTFATFYLANGASLFTSVISLLFFLSIILTSGYAEEAFLKALPKRLIIGLFTLIFSILFLMLSFSMSAFLVFGKRYKTVRTVLTVLIVVAVVPATLFVLFQFRLLVAFLSSTFGRGRKILEEETQTP